MGLNTKLKMIFPNIIAVQFYWTVLKETVSKFIEDDAFTHAAALAYYTIFSLPPMLLIILFSATRFYDETEVKSAIFGEIETMIEPESALQLSQTLDKLQVFEPSFWATVLGIGILVFTSTTVFVTMQNALNQIFQVKAKPKGSGFLKLIKDRVLSFTILLGIAFILLVSLSVNALIAAFATYLDDWIGTFSTALTIVTSIVLPILIIALLFAMLFKFLPDANLKWRDTWFGAFLTTILFAAGKYLISFYIGNSSVVGLYETAGSVMVIMLWVFYASLIFLFGAVFTYVRAEKLGSGISPSDYAVRVIQKEIPVERGADAEAIR